MAGIKFAWWKLFAVWITFLLLHFSYKAFPGLLFQIIAEANETIFLHMKMLFVAYSLITIVEFFFRRRKLNSPGSFLASRGLIAAAFPWLTITFWFTAWASNIRLPIAWELAYSNVMVILGTYLAIRMEELFENVEFRPAIRWMILLLFLTSVFVYVSFSLNPPVHFFTTPPE